MEALENKVIDLEVEQVRHAYEKWHLAGEGLIGATIDLGRVLYEARLRRSSNQDFSVWLDDNGFKETLDKHDRAGFILIGRFPAIALEIMSETSKRSPQTLAKAIRNRVPRDRKTINHKAQKRRKQVKKEDQIEFAKTLLQHLVKRRKEGYYVRLSKNWKPEALRLHILIDLLVWVEKQLGAFIDNRVVSWDETLQATGLDGSEGEENVS